MPIDFYLFCLEAFCGIDAAIREGIPNPAKTDSTVSGRSFWAGVSAITHSFATTSSKNHSTRRIRPTTQGVSDSMGICAGFCDADFYFATRPQKNRKDAGAGPKLGEAAANPTANRVLQISFLCGIYRALLATTSTKRGSNGSGALGSRYDDRISIGAATPSSVSSIYAGFCYFYAMATILRTAT